MATKTHVLEFIKHDRTLRSGRNLYNKFVNKNLAIQSYLATTSNTPKNVKIMCYELCKLVGIPERQLNALLNQPVMAKTNITPIQPKRVSLEELLLNYTDSATKEETVLIAKELGLLVPPVFSKGAAGNKQRKEFVKLITDSDKPVRGKNVKLDKIITTHTNSFTQVILEKKEALITTKLNELPDVQKESIKLRDQFPFLKENDCPKVLHLLVADLITAFEDFKTNQPLLHKAASQESLKELCATVKDTFIRKSEAFEELEYYGKNKALLGKHPLFKQLAEEEEILKLPTPDLTKKISNLVNNINRNKKKASTAEDRKAQVKYLELVANQERLKVFAETELAKR